MTRNVIMIATDQQQMQAMSCADPSYRTPNLDRLARMGIRFTGAISTSAQCSPSRATWMTGKYPHQVGVNNIGHILDPGEWGIAKQFNAHGFETAYFGKWHLGLTPADHDFQITDYRIDGLELDGANGDPRFHSHKDAVSTTQALNYLEDYRGEKPFFMTVCWYMPHPNAPEDHPFEYLQQDAAVFPKEHMPVPDSFHADDLSTKPAFQKERASKTESALTEDTVKRDAQRYRAMLSLMDRNLGRLLDRLESKGLLDNTAILFTSDHGDMQGAHRLRLKGVIPYKELYNVPMILYVPGIEPARKVVPDLLSTAAVPGTLLEAAGVPVSEHFEGGSFLNMLQRTERPAEENVFFEHYKAYWGYHPFCAVQTAKWKYVFYYEEGMEEMYDLAADPDENVNVAGRPEFDVTRRLLKDEVDRWWEATGALKREPIIDESNPWGREV
jgi:arylsulfatase A-like enzyme